MSILVFKTSINTINEFNQVNSLLRDKFDIEETTIDFQDCDKVLRVVSKNGSSVSISNEVKNLNFLCEELED
jgi:hypothetical protein